MHYVTVANQLALHWTYCNLMALWHTVLLIPHLFRLGSGAGGSPVPTHEPNYLFDKTTVQYGFLAKNNFDAGNNTDDYNKLPQESYSYFYDV